MNEMLNTEFRKAIDEECKAAISVKGLINKREVRLLFISAAIPTAQGEILEIGSFKGRSTTILAKGALWAAQNKIVACDYFPPPTNPNDPAVRPRYEIFIETLERNGISENVEIHRKFSAELAKDWNRPIRLLWIDGDHSYPGVKADVDGFFPHLVPGAIVALHDIGRSRLPGPTTCFMEDILMSDGFGMCGMCHYTGWAQFIGSGGLKKYRLEKRKAYRFLAARKLQQVLGTKMRPLMRWRYKRFRRSGSFEKWVLSVYKDLVPSLKNL
jgi:predicted O-methyltransferase YrrM